MTSTDTAAARRRERAAQGATSTTVVGALVLEVDDLRERVNSHDRVLSPAFRPRKEDPSAMSTRGPGAYPAEPVVLRQASSRTDPWAGDYEHSPEFLREIADGRGIPVLRRKSAEHAVASHQASQPSPVMHEAPAWCGLNGCRPATPCVSCQGHRTVVRDSSGSAEAPQQRSTAHQNWEQFPDHAPGSAPAHSLLPPPEFAQVRAHAPQIPGHTGAVMPGPGA